MAKHYCDGCGAPQGGAGRFCGEGCVAKARSAAVVPRLVERLRGDASRLDGDIRMLAGRPPPTKPEPPKEVPIAVSVELPPVHVDVHVHVTGGHDDPAKVAREVREAIASGASAVKLGAGTEVHVSVDGQEVEANHEQSALTRADDPWEETARFHARNEEYWEKRARAAEDCLAMPHRPRCASRSPEGLEQCALPPTHGGRHRRGEVEWTDETAGALVVGVDPAGGPETTSFALVSRKDARVVKHVAIPPDAPCAVEIGHVFSGHPDDKTFACRKCGEVWTAAQLRAGKVRSECRKVERVPPIPTDHAQRPPWAQRSWIEDAIARETGAGLDALASRHFHLRRDTVNVSETTEELRARLLGMIPDGAAVEALIVHDARLFGADGARRQAFARIQHGVRTADRDRLDEMAKAYWQTDRAFSKRLETDDELRMRLHAALRTGSAETYDRRENFGEPAKDPVEDAPTALTREMVFELLEQLEGDTLENFAEAAFDVDRGWFMKLHGPPSPESDEALRHRIRLHLAKVEGRNLVVPARFARMLHEWKPPADGKARLGKRALLEVIDHVAKGASGDTLIALALALGESVTLSWERGRDIAALRERLFTLVAGSTHQVWELPERWRRMWLTEVPTTMHSLAAVAEDARLHAPV
jgi:hypothetical protein